MDAAFKMSTSWCIQWHAHVTISRTSRCCSVPYLPSSPFTAPSSPTSRILAWQHRSLALFLHSSHISYSREYYHLIQNSNFIEDLSHLWENYSYAIIIVSHVHIYRTQWANGSHFEKMQFKGGGIIAHFIKIQKPSDHSQKKHMSISHSCQYL